MLICLVLLSQQLITGKMGIDLVAGGRRVGHNVRKAPVSQDVYLKLLVKLYRFVCFCHISPPLTWNTSASWPDVLSLNLPRLSPRDCACLA